jgi:hypothetical protein
LSEQRTVGDNNDPDVEVAKDFVLKKLSNASGEA